MLIRVLSNNKTQQQELSHLNNRNLQDFAKILKFFVVFIFRGKLIREIVGNEYEYLHILIFMWIWFRFINRYWHFCVKDWIEKFVIFSFIKSQSLIKWNFKVLESFGGCYNIIIFINASWLFKQSYNAWKSSFSCVLKTP